MHFSTRLFFLCVTTSFSVAAFCADTPIDVSAKVPHMSREQANAYIGREQLALTADNLVSPIFSGDVNKVEALLSAGVDPNAKGSLPKSTVQLAVGACAGSRVDIDTQLVMLEVLLGHGAKVNEPAMGGLTPLIVAAQQCQAPIVKRLVRAGADMNYHTPQGFTPLSMAFIVSNYDAAEALIDAGARLTAEGAAKLLDGKKDDARRVALIKRATGK